MEDFEKEQQQEMQKQVRRYEYSKITGDKTWFDSDNYIDIMDWYTIHDMQQAAEEVTLAAYKFYPDNEEIVSRYTLILTNKGEYEKAIYTTKCALKVIDSDDLRIDLASLYIESQTDFDEALILLLDVLKREKDNYFVYLLLGRIYLERGDYISAETYLRKGIELNCNDTLLLGCYSDCSLDISLKERMMEFLCQLTAENSFNDLLWTTLGIVYSRYEYLDKAIDAFDYAIAIKPEGEIRHSCKADCLIAKKEYTAARQELELAIKYSSNDNFELHIVLAGLLMRENNYAEALLHLYIVYDRGQEITDKTYLLDMALCYYFLNQPDEAILKTKESLDTDIAPEIIVDFARRVYDNGFKNEGEDIFEAIITNNTESYTIELASVTLAALKSRDGNTFEAVKIMENTLDELHSCTEDFWYAFLRITCQDEIYDGYTTKTLQLLMSLDSFPVYLKEHYPDIFDNPNYKRCLKQVYHV